MEGPYEPLPQPLQIGQPLSQLLQLTSEGFHFGHGGGRRGGGGREGIIITKSVSTDVTAMTMFERAAAQSVNAMAGGKNQKKRRRPGAENGIHI